MKILTSGLKHLLCKRIILSVFIIWGAVVMPLLYSQAREPMVTSKSGFGDRLVTLGESVLEQLTFRGNEFTMTVYPAAGFSPSTGLEYGIMPVIKFHPPGDSLVVNTATVAPYVLFSTSGMFELSLDVEASWGRKWMLAGKGQYLFLPDAYYGNGKDGYMLHRIEYNSVSTEVTGHFVRLLRENLYLGLGFDLGHSKFLQPDEVISAQPLPLELYGGWTNGFGPVFILDSRNSVSFPSSGMYLKLSGLFFDGLWGSDYNYQWFKFDARHYHKIFRTDDVLAHQLVLDFSSGNNPFYKMALLGGKRSIRAIPHPHQYVDSHLWIAQSEYRKHIWWRFGGVAFAGAGNVFHSSEGVFNQMHWFGGAGIRFRVLPNEKLNFRMDYALSNKGDKAFYFTIREAF
jgi:hypothetical protein